MFTVIVSENRRVVAGLEAHLRSLGSCPSRVFSSLSELSERSPLSPMAFEMALVDLDSIPLGVLGPFPSEFPVLLLGDTGMATEDSGIPRLRKPFGLPGLADALTDCISKSVLKKDHLLVLGARADTVLEAVERVRSRAHWRGVLAAERNGEIQSHLGQNASCIGAVLICGKIDQASAITLRRWKRTPGGRRTPLAFWVDHPERALPCRTFLDFVRIRTDSFRSGIELELCALSENAAAFERNRFVIRRALCMLARGNNKSALKLLTEKFNPANPDPRLGRMIAKIHLNAGNPASAILPLRSSISVNPCHPGSFLLLKKAIGALSKADQETARTYCPRHPVEGLDHA